tara:strand:- start:2143 stop:2493 length:351 start_codon:yes stop_codon:yes gene_type:complete
MVQRRTNKGQVIDMDALTIKGENEVALGNMRVNAKGDKLGDGGKVVQAKEEVAREYYANNPKAVVQSVSIKDAVDRSPIVDEASKIVKPSVKKTKVKKTKEVELPNGDIEIQEVEE